jgi:MiaB/RimO family radical SAM methylthiotransferase
VQLSLEETYADITPVRRGQSGKMQDDISAYISIMRGCNNMCSYCVVPFTRGRERSRDIDSIVREAEQLFQEGYREITLLGQNVNSYHDASSLGMIGEDDTSYQSAKGFDNLYKRRGGEGPRFAELLARVASVDPLLRVRFTSPHPKDFPDEVLQVVADRPNVCSSLHLPVQSGSTAVLRRMRRGYSKDAFLELAHHTRSVIPGVALSTDVIAGFCGETEEDHRHTLDVLEEVRFEQAFMFAYSRREGTHAAYKMEDDVDDNTKQRRTLSLTLT